MTEQAVEMPSIEELLAGELTREMFRHLRELIHSSFSNYRFVDRRAIELTHAFRDASSASEKKALGLKAGIVLTALGQYKESIRVLSETKDGSEARFYLAFAMMRQERYKEAASLLSTGFSGDEEALAMLAEIHILSGRHDDALQVIEKAGLNHEDSALACYLGGRIAESQGEHERAMDLYRKAIQQDPSHVPSLFRLAFNHDMNGQDEKAIELYERCSSLSPTDVSVLTNLGTLYEDHDLYYEAVDCYKRILAIEPNNLRVRMYLKDAESSLTMWVDEEEIKKMKLEDEVLRIPVSDFELSVRSRNCLERMGITTLGDLTRVSEQDLLSFKNFGETSLNEIREMLNQKALRLGQSLELPQEAKARATATQKELESKLNVDVMSLNLSTRARRCMERLEVKTLGDLIKFTEDELLAMPNFGRTSVNELKEKLAPYGLELKKKKAAQEK